MIKKISILCMTIITFSTLINISTVKAFESDGNTSTDTSEYIEGDLQKPETYEKQVSQILSNPNIDEVVVINSNYEISNEAIDIQDLETSLSRAVTTYRYRISSVKNTSDWAGSIIATAQGEPGDTLSISKTKTISNTYSATISADITKTISSAVGFSVTGSSSISISGSATVPSKINGKNVKTMNLNAKTLYKKKTFKIDRHKSVGGLNYGWTNNFGSGSASKPYGIKFTKSYTYK